MAFLNDSAEEYVNSLIEYEDKISRQFLEHDRVKDKLHEDPFIAGLLYIHKIDENNSRSYGFCHDSMYVMTDLSKFSKTDILHLHRLGFIIDKENMYGFYCY